MNFQFDEGSAQHTATCVGMASFDWNIHQWSENVQCTTFAWFNSFDDCSPTKCSRQWFRLENHLEKLHEIYVCIPQASLEFDFSNGFFFCLGATNHQTSNAIFGHWNSVFKFEWFCWRCLKKHSLTAPHMYVKLFFEFLTNELYFVWPFRSFWPCRLALKISFDTEF